MEPRYPRKQLSVKGTIDGTIPNRADLLAPPARTAQDDAAEVVDQQAMVAHAAVLAATDLPLRSPAGTLDSVERMMVVGARQMFADWRVSGHGPMPPVLAKLLVETHGALMRRHGSVRGASLDAEDPERLAMELEATAREVRLRIGTGRR